MTRTISVDQGDLELHRNDLVIIDGLESLRQRVVQRLGLIQGEWFLATDQGIPYIQEIYQRPFNLGLSTTILADAIRSVEGVTDVSDIRSTVDPDTRRLSFRATVGGAEGETEVAI